MFSDKLYSAKLLVGEKYCKEPLKKSEPDSVKMFHIFVCNFIVQSLSIFKTDFGQTKNFVILYSFSNIHQVSGTNVSKSFDLKELCYFFFQH